MKKRISLKRHMSIDWMNFLLSSLDGRKTLSTDINALGTNILKQEKDSVQFIID
jgi:hypothetical protein